MKNYILAIAIVLSTIIYVFGNRYSYSARTANVYASVFDKFTGKVYYSIVKERNVVDFVDGTYTKENFEIID